MRGEAVVRCPPGSQGVAEGPARVIRHTSEFARLQPGDVLVAPYTNPAWTPLFQRAAAVVVDSGGACRTPPSSRANTGFPPSWAPPMAPTGSRMGSACAWTVLGGWSV